MRSWWVVPVVTAVVLGLVLGGVLYLVRPLRLTASAVPTTASRPAVTPGASSSPALARPSATPASASPKPSATSARPVPAGPDFTQRALLQSSEFIQYKWVKADDLSLTTGVSTEPILRCLRPDRVTTRPVAAYAATHLGQTTLAGEQVIRYYTVSDARGVFDQLSGEVGKCADLGSTRRALVGKRHDPDLEGISQTRWWNLRGAGKSDPMRSVLVIMRVDDRLMALCLTSEATDPEKTTDIIPLMRQGGLRMI